VAAAKLEGILKQNQLDSLDEGFWSFIKEVDQVLGR